ncbi:MAG: diol dehydratase small subunit [Burkholderiales bacterium]|nr:diol dehydratase small subunit [Anaerolineae bacterium]
MSDPHYPLIENADDLKAFSGRRLSHIDLDSLDELSAADLRIHADTLRLQAEVARKAGYDQLAANLLRAAELTVVPNAEVLKIYELLRPNRASWEQLTQLADYLEQTYAAHENARFIREAAEAYHERGLLKR